MVLDDIKLAGICGLSSAQSNGTIVLQQSNFSTRGRAIGHDLHVVLPSQWVTLDSGDPALVDCRDLASDARWAREV